MIEKHFALWVFIEDAAIDHVLRVQTAQSESAPDGRRAERNSANPAIAVHELQEPRDPEHALRVLMRELAASRVRFGYRRLTVLLRREGWAANAKRIYRLTKSDKSNMTLRKLG